MYNNQCSVLFHAGIIKLLLGEYCISLGWWGTHKTHPASIHLKSDKLDTPINYFMLCARVIQAADYIQSCPSCQIQVLC